MKRTDVQQRVLQLVRDSGLAGISGYQVAVQLELNGGRAYAILGKFSRAGAIERLDAVQGSTIGDRRPAQPYRLTEAGRATLEEWLSRR